jgi:LysR family glycine cleavage system transcriptional activator
MIKRRKLPSMTGLQVLVSIAFHGSTSAAALQLAMTQSAVSKQLLSFEQLIGGALFSRSPQGMALTELGKIYLEHARVVIKAMDDAALRATRLRPGPEVLRLVVPPILGDRWLLPRFQSFSDAHPEVEVHFTSFVSNNHADAADGIFRYVVEPGVGEEGSYLFGKDVRLVGSPAYWERLGNPMTIEDAAKGVMLEHPQTQVHWQIFAAANQREGLKVHHITRFGYYTMVIRAALAGQGMALIPEGLISEELASGRLVNPAQLSYRSPYGYWFVKPRLHASKDAIGCFDAWLSEQAKAMAD